MGYFPFPKDHRPTFWYWSTFNLPFTMAHGSRFAPGSILVRQRGTHYKAGKNVRRAKDDSLFARIDGFVLFENKGGKGRFISILTAEEAATLNEKRAAAAATN